MSSRLSRGLLVLAPLLLLLAGCTALPQRSESRLPPDRAAGVVLVADGAGGRATCGRALAEVAEPYALHVRSFPWAHWYGPGLADVTDVAHARRQGELLADEVRALIAERPRRPVSLVGYSAGCAVVLAAAERLPPDSLDRV